MTYFQYRSSVSDWCGFNTPNELETIQWMESEAEGGMGAELWKLQTGQSILLPALPKTADQCGFWVSDPHQSGINDVS